MPPSPVAEDVFQSDMESTRAGRWVIRRPILLWRWLWDGLKNSFKDLKDWGWRAEQNHKNKREERAIIFDNFLPLSYIASYSLLRNLRDALKGITLIYYQRVIRPTHHPGFHLNRRMNRWNSKLSNLFNSDELFKRNGNLSMRNSSVKLS